MIDNYHSKKIDLLEVAKLHKKTFVKSPATLLSIKSLSKYYEIMLENKNLYLIYAFENDNQLMGALFLKPKIQNKIGIKEIFLLTSQLIKPIFLNPIFYFLSYLKNRKLYFDLNYDFEIQTIFVNSNYRNKNIGSDLINYLNKINFSNLIVNTNIAEKFYLKNKFILIRKIKDISIFIK